MRRLTTTTILVDHWKGSNVWVTERETVPLFAQCKGLGVTPGHGSDIDWFSMTHLASGRQVCLFETQAAAERAMRRAARLFDWTVITLAPGDALLNELRGILAQERRKEDRERRKARQVATRQWKASR
jgi:hypothetical protein